MLFSFVKRDTLAKADAIVVLSGNGFERTHFAVELYKKKMANTLVMVGATGSRPASEMALYAAEHDVPEDRIIVGSQSRNTRENALEVLAMASHKNWRTIILVTSPHHQLRAYLTFKKAWSNSPDRPVIINYPPTNYSWFDRIEKSRATNTVFRWQYLFTEPYKIIKYSLKGDL